VDNKITRCDGIIVNGINHEKEVLKEYVDKPYMMSMDYDTNVLYYTYTGPLGTSFIPAALNLKTKENYLISGVEGGFATSVDPKTHKIYIGGSNGIYAFDYQTKATTKLDITNDNIWQVFAKDGVYFTTYPHESAFAYKNGERKKIAGIGDSKALLVGLDKDDNIFFSNSSGLFFRPKDDDKAINIGDYTVNSFTADANGKLYFSTPTGIFTLNEVTKNDAKVSKLTGINNIYGAVIESDGTIIYAAENSIIRLKSTGQECSERF